MKILFVLDFFTPHIGGVETLFENITSRLINSGIGVAILTQRLPGTKKFEINSGREIFRVATPFRHMFPISCLKKGAEISKKCDIIHTSSYVGTGASLLLNKFAKKPLIGTFHEVWGDKFFEFENLFSAYINHYFEKATVLFYRNEILTCPSYYTKMSLMKLGVPEKNIHVIYHGIDNKLFNPKVKPLFDFDFPTYLFFGRPGISKGLEYLIDAVPLINRELPDAKLVLMISSKLKREFKIIMEKIRDMGIRENIVMIRPQTQEHVPGVIRSTDCVVVPSLSEGFGFSTVESMACGKSVIASNTASLPEIIENKKTGILIRPKSPKEIAENVTKLLKNEKLRNELGRNAAKSVKKFNWDKSVKKYIEIYENAKVYN